MWQKNGMKVQEFDACPRIAHSNRAKQLYVVVALDVRFHIKRIAVLRGNILLTACTGKHRQAKSYTQKNA